MTFAEISQIAGTIIVSVGGSGALIFGLSSWLGKVWADRLMQRERARHDQELAEFMNRLQREREDHGRQLEAQLHVYKEVHLKAHHDKALMYRMAVDLIAEILTAFLRVSRGRMESSEYSQISEEFHRKRIQLYGYLGIQAPQSVMDAQDQMMEYLIDVEEGQRELVWADMREIALRLLNECRRDIGVGEGDVSYRGNR